ncbi:MAG: hypothetical protein DMF04_08445 [Verrucomicrobia bacterium]|nr:MAG: hypothetical protein DMF04_08445 [Verrucomicrobiota bacterium]
MVIEFVLALCQKWICSWVGYRASPDGFNNPPEHAGSARRTFFCPSQTADSLVGVLRATRVPLQGEPRRILRATIQGSRGRDRSPSAMPMAGRERKKSVADAALGMTECARV